MWTLKAWEHEWEGKGEKHNISLSLEVRRTRRSHHPLVSHILIVVPKLTTQDPCDRLKGNSIVVGFEPNYMGAKPLRLAKRVWASKLEECLRCSGKNLTIIGASRKKPVVIQCVSSRQQYHGVIQWQIKIHSRMLESPLRKPTTTGRRPTTTYDKARYGGALNTLWWEEDLLWRTMRPTKTEPPSHYGGALRLLRWEEGLNDKARYNEALSPLWLGEG